MESNRKVSARLGELAATNQSKDPCFSIVGKQQQCGDSTQVITAVAFDLEGNRLAVGELDGTLKIYNPTSGKV